MPLRRSQRLGYLALTASLLVFGVIVLGGVVRATQSGGACPDWPICWGQWRPPQGMLSAQLDYAHRLATALAAPWVLATAWAGWRSHGQRRIKGLATLALLLMMAQIALGAWVWSRALQGERGWLSALHLGLSLSLLAVLLMGTVAAFYPSLSLSPALRRSPFARLTFLTLLALFGLWVSGAALVTTGAALPCKGWPLCVAMLLPHSGAAWLHLSHRLLTLVTGALMAALVYQAWRSQRTQTVILVAATAAGALFISQALMGAQLVQRLDEARLAAPLIWLHQASATATWAVMVILGMATALAGRSPEDERHAAKVATGRKGFGRDLLLLTKPLVVALLLVTTYAGMVIGARALPSPGLTFWTLLFGFMAAGGSGAINQYIDRGDDQKMQRTQKRPIPAGRLTPAEGLAFGVGLCLLAFYGMAALVNLLAAGLTLAGMVYYVLIYSLWLKKTTAQNIVIGGGAGAIPPLVGWAAATGGLNIPAVFLFAVVFLWTPPHFWALALVRRKDYARAGVPMLPVVRGERETRGQILIYTLELVGLTLLLPLFGLGGSLYLLGATGLGGWLLLTAWRLWKQGGNRFAWKMYRFSSLYLALWFVVLMLDRLV